MKSNNTDANPNLGYFIDPGFEGINWLFVSSFEKHNDRMAHTGYFVPKVEIKDYNVMADGQNFFDQPVKSDMRTYHYIIYKNKCYYISYMRTYVIR